MSIRIRQSTVRSSLSSPIDNAHIDFLTPIHDIDTRVPLSHTRHSPGSQTHSRSGRPTSPRPSSFRSYSPLIPIAPRHPTPRQLQSTLPPIYPTLLAVSGGLQSSDSIRSAIVGFSPRVEITVPIADHITSKWSSSPSSPRNSAPCCCHDYLWLLHQSLN
jgi:hypothetical protein